MLKKCSSCGHVFERYQLTLDRYINVLGRADPYSREKLVSDGELVNHRDVYLKKYGYLKTEFKEKGVNTFLDSSCSFGHLIDFLHPQARGIGIEPERYTIRRGQMFYPTIADKLLPVGFEKISQELLHDLLLVKQIDAILFSACFRQLQDPEKALKIIDAVVSPGGYVFITEGIVPQDSNLRQRYEQIDPGYIAEKEHLQLKQHYLTEKDFDTLFERISFSRLGNPYTREIDGHFLTTVTYSRTS